MAEEEQIVLNTVDFKLIELKDEDATNDNGTYHYERNIDGGFILDGKAIKEPRYTKEEDVYEDLDTCLNDLDYVTVRINGQLIKEGFPSK